MYRTEETEGDDLFFDEGKGLVEMASRGSAAPAGDLDAAFETPGAGARIVPMETFITVIIGESVLAPRTFLAQKFSGRGEYFLR